MSIKEKLLKIIDNSGALEKLKSLVGDITPQLMEVLEDVIGEVLPEGSGGSKAGLTDVLKGMTEQMDAQQIQLSGIKTILKATFNKEDVETGTSTDDGTIS